MTQSSIPSSELIDLAWNAANAANEAFNRAGEAEAQLDQLRAVGSLGLSGVTITDAAYSELEGRQTNAWAEFDMLTNMAAPAMLMPDSPFAVLQEGVSRTDAAVGVPGGRAIERPGAGIEGQYPDVTSDELIAFSERREYGEGQAMRVWNVLERLEVPMDLVSLRDAVRGWLERNPKIRGLGPRGISFLADYLNARLPDAEPLAVAYPPKSRPSKANELNF